MAAPPTLAEDVKLSAPLFLRKLRRRQDWGSDETPLEERADVLDGRAVGQRHIASHRTELVHDPPL